MASFNENIDLMKLKGAQLLSVNHPQTGRPVNGIFIPTDWNDIQVRESRQQQGQYTATLRLAMWQAKESYVAKIRENRLQRGEDVGQLPSHTLEVNYGEDFERRAREAARKRIVAEHPEWQTNPDLQNPDFNQDLRRAVTAAVRTNVGTAYAIIPRSERQQMQPAAAYGQQPADGVGAWTPPAVDPLTGQPVGQQQEYDDLPF